MMIKLYYNRLIKLRCIMHKSIFVYKHIGITITRPSVSKKFLFNLNILHIKIKFVKQKDHESF